MSVRSGRVCARAWLAAGALALGGIAVPSQGLAGEPAVSQDEGLDEAREAARVELVASFETLAEWAGKKKLFAKRADVYLQLIHFQPGHEVALRGLGYTKDKNGEWKEPKEKRPPRDFDKTAAKEFDERNAAITEAYFGALLGLLEGHGDDVTPKQRSAIVTDLLFADPDDARARALIGEARLDGAWVLVETARAKARRPVIKDLVRKAFRQVPPAEVVEPSAKEAAFGLRWKGVYASTLVRSLSTGSAKEAERMTQAMAASLSLFNDSTGAEAELPPNLTVYTLANEGDKETFLGAHPDVDDEYRKFLAQLEGSGIMESDDFAQWSEDPLRRLDSLVRISIMWMFVDGFEVTPKTGWAFEGFGLYLTRELVGTRLTWFVRPSEYLVKAEDNALQARLLDTRTNWMAEALKVLSKPKRPNLPIFLGKDVNQLTTEELLYSYVIAAYLLEAYPEAIPKILGRIGGGEASALVLEQELGRSMEELPAHLLRWLDERR